MTINSQVDFPCLGSSKSGQNSSAVRVCSYASTRNAMLSDQISVDGLMAISNLAAGPNFDTLINHTADHPSGSGDATPYLDADDGINNTQSYMTLTNSRALDLTAEWAVRLIRPLSSAVILVRTMVPAATSAPASLISWVLHFMRMALPLDLSAA